MPGIPRWNSRVTMPSAWPTCVFNRVQVCAPARLCTYVFIQGEPERTEHSDIPARETVLMEISRPRDPTIYGK